MVWCKAYFDILNRFGVTHEYAMQTDGWTDRHLLANAAHHNLCSQKSNVMACSCL